MSKRGLVAALAALATTSLGLALAGPAYAENPKPETRTVALKIVDREDSGTGDPVIWALDTFDRKVTVVGGPHYQFPNLAAAESAQREKEADETVAEQLKLKVDICDIVRAAHLVWKYEATVADDGTFVTTNDSETGSPGEDKSLVQDAEGDFQGGAVAKFYAPAHWCSFKGSRYDGTERTGKQTGSTGEFIGKLFDGKVTAKHPEKGLLVDWGWTYTRCHGTAGAEKWVNAIGGNEGDIRGVACPTPSASPTPSPSPTTTRTTPAPGGVAGGGEELPKTGSPVAVLTALGGALVLAGAAALVALRRRRRSEVTFAA